MHCQGKRPRALVLTTALLLFSSANGLRPSVHMAATVTTPTGMTAAPADVSLQPVSNGAVSGGAIKSSALWQDSGALIL